MCASPDEAMSMLQSDDYNVCITEIPFSSAGGFSFVRLGPRQLSGYFDRGGDECALFLGQSIGLHATGAVLSTESNQA